jgi:exodeoxyribonuclease VII small subunit
VTKKTSAFDFEKSLEELNRLVVQMEQGELSLEKSLEHFEQGIALIRQCQKALQEAEQKVQILTQENGQSKLKPFKDESV